MREMHPHLVVAALISFCESGCAYHGITDFVTNTLMKVQHDAVSENSPQVLCTLYGDPDLEIRTLGKLDGICGMD